MNSSGKMDVFLGKTLTVKEVCEREQRPTIYFMENASPWCFYEDDFQEIIPTTTRTKLAKIRILNGVLLAVIITLFAIAFQFLSYHYCHGSNHNARGWYCEATYADEEGYRAL